MVNFLNCTIGFALPVPATIINSVETSYPAREDLALGLLYIGANTVAIAMTFIGQVLLPPALLLHHSLPHTYPPPSGPPSFHDHVCVLRIAISRYCLILIYISDHALQELLLKPEFGPAPLFPYSVWVLGTMALALVPILLFNGRYLRLEKDIGDSSPVVASPVGSQAVGY